MKTSTTAVDNNFQQGNNANWSLLNPANKDQDKSFHPGYEAVFQLAFGFGVEGPFLLSVKLRDEKYTFLYGIRNA